MARTTRLNGTPTTITTLAPSKAARKPAPTKAQKEASARTIVLRQRIAGVVGGVGVSVLALSVVHCTEAIALLTGSHWLLAALLAIGIDAGMVATELAELIAHEPALKRWARAYIGTSVVMSMGLNAYAFGMHASITWAGAILGLIIPALVLMLGRVAGHLAK